MDKFGLTESEKNTNLHNYNHALFRNMMFFMDSVWEINMLTKTVVILEDRNEPERSDREYGYEELFLEYQENYVVEKEREILKKYLMFEHLAQLEEEVSFELHLSKGGSGPELYNIVLTPAFDETHTLYCVYLSSRNLESEVRRELEEYHRQEQFLYALLSNSYFHFSFDLSGDCMIHEDYATKDGKHLVREWTKSELPVSFDCFIRKWFETCQPRFEHENGRQIFTAQYLKQAYWNKEHLLELEVKQDDLDGSGTPSIMQIFIVLMERPEDKHIHANVIWMNTGHFQKETIRDNLELRSANSAKTDFLARMSHDIRTPMNAIIGMTAIASRHLNNPERVAECLKEISVSGKYLLNLLSEVLDMSKIESGKMQLQEKEFDLSLLLDNICTICRFQCKEKEHDFSVDIQELEHTNVIGDSQRLQQSLMNLIDNAIKYTPNGGKIRLAIAEKATDRPNVGCFEFVLEDSGIGMDKTDLENLFEPFVRSEDRRVTKVQGTGLGMPIAKNIVQMMNGTIDVVSELEKGTTVTVMVFLKLREQAEESESPLDDNPMQLDAFDRKDYSGKRVLLVEDNRPNAMITKEILEMTNLEVENVWNGKEAVDRMNEVEDGYYDLIFMDIQMPLMDGYEATRAIRAMDRDYAKKVPILAMSADAFTEDIQRSKACGMNEHLVKPIDYRRLVYNLDKFLG